MARLIDRDRADRAVLEIDVEPADLPRLEFLELAAALGRITAKTFVMPIDEDMFFPPRDCRREQELIVGSELRVLPSVAGHFGLFGFEPAYLAEFDRCLSELLATPAPTAG